MPASPQSATIGVGGTTFGSSLMDILDADDIQPGDEPSYQVCRELYLSHPLGAKLVETPVKMAQSIAREVEVEGFPDEVTAAFLAAWKDMAADYYIRGLMFTSRIYGMGSLVVGEDEKDCATPFDPWACDYSRVYFNVLDPLNTSGTGTTSMNQDPNSPMFQKQGQLVVNGKAYHGSRSIVMFNEQPVYLSYTGSAFGYAGRSVFQRVLYPMKSFIQSMKTDDMVTRKAGLLVAMLKPAGSIISGLMQAAANLKRTLLQRGETDGVLSIGHEEKIESLNMQNTDNAMTTARNNILKNIATGNDMPAQILENETFAGGGFGEGTEDTKNVVRYVNGVRKDMQPAYDFMDRIVMHKAWTQEFYEAQVVAQPELYADMDYKTTFYAWKRAWSAVWPSLLEEPESEVAKLEKVKVDGVVQVFNAMHPTLDPENQATLALWAQENLNNFHLLFRAPMMLDADLIADHAAEREEAEDEAATAAPALRAVK